MSIPDYSKRNYLLPKGCKDLADALIITISRDITASELAALVGQAPVQIIADLFKLGVFAAAEAPLKFEIVRQVAEKYGYVAKQEE